MPFHTPHLVKVHGGKLNRCLLESDANKLLSRLDDAKRRFFYVSLGTTRFYSQHIATNVHPYVNGYYVGSETYIPAKDYITSLPNDQLQLRF